jgi:hypothetical protein
MLPTTLVARSLDAPATAAAPQPECDTKACEKPNGNVCPAELCGRSGTWKPKVQCPRLVPHPHGGVGAAAPQARAAASGEPSGDPDQVIAERRKAVARIRPKLDALIAEVQAAKDAGVLSEDEEDLLAVLERWAEELKQVPAPLRSAKRPAAKRPAKRPAPRRPARRTKRG